MWSLTNVPPASAKEIEMRAIVEGQNIKIVRAKKHAAENDWVRMVDFFVGDHMLAKPDDLRQMIGDNIIAAILRARDAGYAQAKAEIRSALGIEQR